MTTITNIAFLSRDYMMLNTTYLFLNRHALPKQLRADYSRG